MEGVEDNGHSFWPDSLSVRANTDGWNAAGPLLNRHRQSSCTQRQARLDGAHAASWRNAGASQASD